MTARIVEHCYRPQPSIGFVSSETDLWIGIGFDSNVVRGNTGAGHHERDDRWNNDNSPYHLAPSDERCLITTSFLVGPECRAMVSKTFA